MSEEDQKWVVVETTYPNPNYAPECELAQLRDTHVDALNEVYDTYKQACDAAKAERADSEYFDQDTFKEDDEPPFDSTTRDNMLDNDNQVLLEVMTVGEYKKQKEATRQRCLELKALKKFDKMLDTKMRVRKAASSRRVYYCFPDWGGKGEGNVPAELEIHDSTDMKSLKDLDQIKSLMYEPKTDIDYSKENVLYKVLSKCTQLEELHLHMAKQNGRLYDDFISGILSAQPALPDKLVVLSMQSCTLSPCGMKALARFACLEHLDIMCAFAYELVVEAKMNSAFMEDDYDCNKYSDEESDEEAYEAPYKGALSEICLKLVKEGRLTRLDLGYGEDRSMVDDLIGSKVKWEIHDALAKKGGRGLTTTEDREPSTDWTSAAAKVEATRLVLQQLVNETDDPQVAKIVKKELADLGPRKSSKKRQRS